MKTTLKIDSTLDLWDTSNIVPRLRQCCAVMVMVKRRHWVLQRKQQKKEVTFFSPCETNDSHGLVICDRSVQCDIRLL